MHFNVLFLSLSLSFFFFHPFHLIYQRWRYTTTSTTNCWIMNHYSSSANSASTPLLPLQPRLRVLYIFFFSNGHNMYNGERERRPARMHRSSTNRANVGNNRSHAVNQQLDTISAANCTILFM